MQQLPVREAVAAAYTTAASLLGLTDRHASRNATTATASQL
jgi:hypothetical protein